MSENVKAENKYEDPRFHRLMNMLARKNSIPNEELEDYYQDVFLEAIESCAESEDDYKRVAYRVARRYGRILKAQRDIEGNVIQYSFDENRDSLRYFDDIDDRYDSPLWEDVNIV